MSIPKEESADSIDGNQVREIYGQLHERLGISVDFNSAEPSGLQFWKILESELTQSLGIGSIGEIEEGRQKLCLDLKRVLEERQIPYSSEQFKDILDQLVDHYFGFGIIDGLLREDSTFAILANGFQEIYFESRGRLQKSALSFQSDAHFKHVIDRICIRNNVDLPSAQNPLKTFSLPGNLTTIVLFPPVTPDSPCLSISHRFAKKPLSIDQLIQFGSLSAEMMRFLKDSIESHLNILVCGHLGSGANTLVNILSGFIPGNERVISIEYENEYALRINHLIKMMANSDPAAENSFSKLLTVAGKMRADRLVLGEFLFPDAYDALNSVNDDFAGSIIRVTARSPRDAVNRLETFVQLNKPALPQAKIRNLIRSSIDLITYQERLYDGSRVVKQIVEVLDGTDADDEIALKEIFSAEQTGVKDGRILKKFVPHGRPSQKIIDKAASFGIEFPTDMFATISDAETAKAFTDDARRSITLSKGNYVFISYSSEDLHRVIPLALELEKNNFSVWLDKWYLKIGKIWTQGLEQAIKNAGAFLVVLTRNSVISEPVMSEILTAKGAELPIIPVRLEECSAPISIIALQYIPYDEEDMAGGMKQLTKVLSEHISNQGLLVEH